MGETRRHRRTPGPRASAGINEPYRVAQEGPLQVDPLARLQPRLEEAELRARLAWETAEILATRLAKIPERHRPHFTPAQRFRILEIRSFVAWSAQEAARVFLVCPNTILNWEKAGDPNARTVGSTVKPTPPIRRAADVVRATVQTLARLGVGGQDLLARILARAGWRVSARSVGRYRRERTVAPPPPPEPGRKTTPVIARFVHNVQPATNAVSTGSKVPLQAHPSA